LQNSKINIVLYIVIPPTYVLLLATSYSWPYTYNRNTSFYPIQSTFSVSSPLAWLRGGYQYEDNKRVVLHVAAVCAHIHPFVRRPASLCSRPIAQLYYYYYNTYIIRILLLLVFYIILCYWTIKLKFILCTTPVCSVSCCFHYS